MAEVLEAGKNLFEILAGGAGVIALFQLGTNNLGLHNTIVLMVGVLVAIAVYGLYRLERKIDGRLDDMESNLNSGFAEILNDDDNEKARTDGSGSWESVIGLNLEDEDISSMPSVAGAAAGGFAGAVFGPQGALVGALIGALAGGGKEYRNLQKQQREHLEEIAWTAYQQKTGSTELTSKMEEVQDKKMQSEKYWIFHFVDQVEMNHYVRISKDDGHVEYKRGGLPGQAKLGDLG